MAYITLNLKHTLTDGEVVKFKAPCDCTAVEGLKVYYVTNGERKSKIFTMKDAHGNDLTGIGNLFKGEAYLQALLNCQNGVAYLQNADTNGYLESMFFKEGVVSTPAYETADAWANIKYSEGQKIIHIDYLARYKATPTSLEGIVGECFSVNKADDPKLYDLLSEYFNTKGRSVEVSGQMRSEIQWSAKCRFDDSNDWVEYTMFVVRYWSDEVIKFSLGLTGDLPFNDGSTVHFNQTLCW